MNSKTVIIFLSAICLILFGVVCGMLLRPQTVPSGQPPTPVAQAANAKPEPPLETKQQETPINPAPPTQQTERKEPPPTTPTLSELAASLAKSVVKIECFDEKKQAISSGTGFFLSDDGKLITNFHVIQNAHYAEATLADGSRCKINGIWTLRRSCDLAVLSTDIRPSAGLRLSAKDTKDIPLGAKVVVMGAPKGLSGSLSDGIISAHRSDVELHGKLQQLLQFTAPVSNGSSGSPIVNLEDGTVIGIATLVRKDAQQLNFAVPTEALKELLYAKRENALEFLTIIRAKTPYPFTEIPRLEVAEYFDYIIAKRLIQTGGTSFRHLQNFSLTSYDSKMRLPGEALKILESERASTFESNPFFQLDLAENWSGSFKSKIAFDKPLSESIGEAKCEETLQHFERSIEIFPENKYAWKSLGYYSKLLWKHDKSRQAYQNCVDQDPTDWEAWAGLAEEYQIAGDKLEASEKGKLRGMQNYRLAFHAANQALKCNPKYDIFILESSIKWAIVTAMGDGGLGRAEAQTLFKEFNLKTEGSYQNRSKDFLANRLPTWSDACDGQLSLTIDDALLQSGDHLELLNLKIRLFCVSGNYKATLAARRLTTLMPLDPDAWAKLGVSLLIGKSFQEARTAISRAAELDPEFTAYWVVLAAIGQELHDADLQSHAHAEIQKTWKGSAEAVTKMENYVFEVFGRSSAATGL
jgi:S1-C subfamily serine protease/Tfp pilus assembly protein PilF